MIYLAWTIAGIFIISVVFLMIYTYIGALKEEPSDILIATGLLIFGIALVWALVYIKQYKSKINEPIKIEETK